MLMEYIATGKVEDEFTEELESAVESFRADDGKERLYMTFQQTIMEERMMAEKRGEARGRKESIIQMVLNMLKHNMSIEDIANVSELSVAEINSMLKNAPAVQP